VREGERLPFVMAWYPSHAPQPHPIDAESALKDTETWWRQWVSRCTYQGRWRDAVVRSLITLKALTYAPTGGIVAAPTTSLPEELGGVRNWDYRYCWVRDATFTLYSLLSAGYTDEAQAWREWLLRSAAGKPSELHIMYGAAGERRLPELDLPWLPGYEGSAPVRTGNAASHQFQLDVYGEILDMAYLSRRAGVPPEPAAWQFIQAIVEFVETAWERPDEGIWEVRGPRRQFTHSKVMAWVALDRAIKLIEEFGRDGPIHRWRRVRDEIHRQVCREGYDPTRGTFVQYYGGKTLDASLLMIPLVGFLPVDDPRVQGTLRAIQSDLMEDGFVHRYQPAEHIDGLPGGEGAFLPCTFWLADTLALMGRHDEAEAIFERLVGLCNDVGLLSEEYDPQRKRLLGNFPQAFSHVGLINTVFNLSSRKGPADDRTTH
jgi:GH15 family glucan-1,4-alpha-glucosidase